MRLTARPSLISRLSVFGAALILAVGLAGCATPPPADDPDAVADFKEINDPLEPANRVFFFAINNGLDVVILRPIALAYHYGVPDVIRNHAHNVLVNLGTPVVLFNDLLEAKPHRARDTLVRMVVNSTIGIAGIFDVATDWGYPAHDADFGMTLAAWGLPDGAFLFLPVLGPSNPRDAVGFGVDQAMDPLSYGGGDVLNGLRWGKLGLGAIDSRERVLVDLDRIMGQALDPVCYDLQPVPPASPGAGSTSCGTNRHPDAAKSPP